MSPFALPDLWKGQALKTYSTFNLAGGLDVMSTPPRGNYLTAATNVQVEVDGSIHPRPGFEVINNASALTGATHGRIRGGVQFIKSNGTSYLVVATSDTVYLVDVATLPSTTVTSLLGGFTSAKRYTFAQLNDLLVICNGVDNVTKYDGTTLAALGGGVPAAGAVVVAHANRLFMFPNNSSRLSFCALNDPTTWTGTTNAGYIDIAPGDGGILTDMSPSGQELVIFKGSRAYRLQGYGPETGYTVVDHLVPTMGTVGSGWAGASTFAFNDVWFASRSGFHRLSAVTQFGDLKESFASVRIAKYFTDRPAINPFDFAPAADYNKPVVLHDAGLNLIHLGLALTTLNYGMGALLVYEPFQKAWTSWNIGNGTIEFTAAWPYMTGNKWKLMLGAVNTSTGGCYILGTTTSAGLFDYTSANAAVAVTSAATHVSDLGAPGIQKSPRYLYMYFKNESTTQNVTVTATDYGGTTLGSATVDVKSTVDTAERVIVRRIDLSGLCEYLQVGVSAVGGASGSWTWLGYRVLWRPRRLVTRAE